MDGRAAGIRYDAIMRSFGNKEMVKCLFGDKGKALFGETSIKAGKIIIFLQKRLPNETFFVYLRTKTNNG